MSPQAGSDSSGRSYGAPPTPPHRDAFIPQEVVPQEVVTEGDGWLSFSEVKDELAKVITRVTRKKNVIVCDSFFSTARYEIASKDRDDHEDKKPWLLSEQDTRYENFTNKEATYTFRTSFEQTSSVTCTILKGMTLRIGAAVGGGFGGNMGFTGGAEYSKSRGAGEGQSHSETKQLMVEIRVPPKLAVIVKELVYRTECSAACHFYLPLGIKKATFIENFNKWLKGKGKVKVEDELKKKDENEGTIKYTTNGKEEEIKVSDLLEDPNLEKEPWVYKREDDSICIKLYSKCSFSKTEHTLETVYQKSSHERLERIMTGKVSQGLPPRVPPPQPPRVPPPQPPRVRPPQPPRVPPPQPLEPSHRHKQWKYNKLCNVE